MIDRVHFENFKSLANVTIDLGRFTVLVGANGCGKSSVLQGIDLLTGVVFDRPSRAATDPTQSIELVVRHDDGDELRVSLNPHIRSIDGPAQKFSRIIYLSLDARELRRTSIAKTVEPRIASDGAGLASTLAWMKGAAEDDLARITADLGRVVPGVKRIKALREEVTERRMDKVDIDGQPVWRPVDDTKIGDRFEIEFDNGTSVPSDLLSEGTVLALGLLTKLREPNRPKLVLLDDIDRGLHLGAQAHLVDVLRELMALDPELQIVCTTHSPYLVDLFTPEEIRVLALDEKRHTHARPLIDHPDFGKWKFGTQTGELWAALGENWVTNGATR